VQLIYVLMPAANALTSALGLRLAACFGRVQTMVVLKLASVLLLVAIGLVSAWLRAARAGAEPVEPSPLTGGSAGGEGGGEGVGGAGGAGGGAAPHTQPLVVLFVVALYLARTALANCTTPLSSSVQMECVQRGSSAAAHHPNGAPRIWVLRRASAG
jgi:hypothetical protein